MGELVICAFGVHYGGGVVLLEALLNAAKGRIKLAYIDTRAFGAASALMPVDRIVTVTPSLVPRLAALRSAPRTAIAGDRLLCFNSLPPLARSPAHTIVYVHTPYISGRGPVFTDGLQANVRVRVERALFAVGERNVDAFWVQTPTVAAALGKRVDRKRVELVPFVDDLLVPEPWSPQNRPPPNVRFIYPAEGVPHKNHVNLLRAWALLDEGGFRPSLDLTLRPEEFNRRLAEANIAKAAMPQIRSQRFPRRENVLDKIRGADAMIFPSRAETFGISLLEATMLETPIIAAEADFIRDVCIPVQTFNPNSPRSIADAVLRFLGTPRPIVQPINAQAFVDRIFS